MRHIRVAAGVKTQLEFEIEENLWVQDSARSALYRVACRATARRSAHHLIDRDMRLVIVSRNGTVLEDTAL